MYEFRNLKDTEFTDIVTCFKEAFSDYVVKMNFDEDYLYHRFKGQNVDFSLSYGAFYDGKLVGFLLNAIGDFEGDKIAFDAATGIVPNHRQNGITTQLFEYCKRDLKLAGIARYVLEVIQENKVAVKTYRKLGLKETKEYACFRQRATKPIDNDGKIIITSMKDFPIDECQVMHTFVPSFENGLEAIKRNVHRYDVAWIGDEDVIEAFAVYDKKVGQIKQLARKENAIKSLEKILLYISTLYEDIPIHNIDFRDKELIESLNRLGFNNFCDQFEMEIFI